MAKRLKVQIGGQKWQVHFVSKRHPKLKPAHKDDVVHGVTYAKECAIYIDKDASPEVIEDTLLHELTHAIFEVGGVCDVIGTLSKDADQAEKAEEDMVRGMTPILHRLLKDLGFKFPSIPEKTT